MEKEEKKAIKTKEKVKNTKKSEEKVKSIRNEKNENNDNNKKKIFQGIGVFAVVLLVLGLAFYVSMKSNGNVKSFNFIDITINEYLDKMKEEKKSIIYVARPGCTWCQKESPIIKSLGAEYDLTIYYLNTDPFWDSDAQAPTEEGQMFMNSSEKYTEGWGTPNTIIVGNGKIIDGEFSYVEKTKLKDLFVRNGIINE